MRGSGALVGGGGAVAAEHLGERHPMMRMRSVTEAPSAIHRWAAVWRNIWACRPGIGGVIALPRRLSIGLTRRPAGALDLLG